MKNFITTTAFLLLFVGFSSAQGNLQFNQVINGELSAYVAYEETSMGSITVPAGKVWKIESVSLSHDDGSYRYTQGNPVFIAHHCVSRLGLTGTDYLPLWLSAGTYDVTATGFDATFEFNYSVVEFNVIP